MKAKEALEVLKQMDPETEVELHFPKKGYSGGNKSEESDHPCGVRYETRAEHFGSGSR